MPQGWLRTCNPNRAGEASLHDCIPPTLKGVIQTQGKLLSHIKHRCGRILRSKSYIQEESTVLSCVDVLLVHAHTGEILIARGCPY